MPNQTPKKQLQRADWKDYELQILKLYREANPNYLVIDNQKLIGKHSKKKRQIDVLVSSPNGIEYIVECKHLNKKVTLPILESFYGMLEDLGIRSGVIITTKGFSSGTENYAKSKGIELRTIDYEYLKDYYYVSPSFIPDVFIKSIQYQLPYCKSCNISILYEIGLVYGMADFESLDCPKCKTKLTEVRSDANHRVIKIFQGNEISIEDCDSVIAKHIYITKEEWMSEKYLIGIPISDKNCCYICKHEFSEQPPTHSKSVYKRRNVCSECIMSERTLLFDYKFI